MFRYVCFAGGKMYQIRQYEENGQEMLLHFLEECLPQSGREFQPDGRHKIY